MRSPKVSAVGVVSRFLVVTVAAFAILGGTALAQTPNPLLGTWKMNVAKSTAKPGPVNKSGTVTIEAAGKGAKYTVDNGEALVSGVPNGNLTPMEWAIRREVDLAA
jgi:hypothetical protein